MGDVHALVQSFILGTKSFKILRNSLSLVSRSWEQPRETSSRERNSNLGVDLASTADYSHVRTTYAKVRRAYLG